MPTNLTKKKTRGASNGPAAPSNGLTRSRRACSRIAVVMSRRMSSPRELRSTRTKPSSLYPGMRCIICKLKIQLCIFVVYLIFLFHILHISTRDFFIDPSLKENKITFLRLFTRINIFI